MNSKHFLTSKAYRGFTLIELLVVIAIIGLLSTVIAGPITEARKKGRDGKKIADLRAINTAIQVYADDNAGQFPPAIDTLTPRYLNVFPTNAATTTPPRDKYMYSAYIDSGGRIVGYHLGVKLEAGNQALNDDRDCEGFDSSPSSPATGACIDGTATDVTSVSNRTWQSGDAGSPAGTSVSTDYGGGSDTGTSVCTAGLNTCVYDLTN